MINRQALDWPSSNRRGSVPLASEKVLHETPDNPVPEVAQAGYFRTYDRRRVRYAVFPGVRPKARGTIVLLHGRNEAIEKYFETVRDLTAMGFWVATFDWRGQGGSERLLSDPLKGYVRRFSDYDLDLERFIEHVVLPDTRLPFYLLAHSTGGLVALSAAPGLSTRIERMVLTAPFVALGGQAISQRRLALLMRIACLAGFATRPVGNYSHPVPFENNDLTSDRERFRRNSAIIDSVPELALGRPTARWLDEALKTMKRVTRQEYLGKIRIPTLVVSPTLDPIVPAAALEALDERFRAGHLIAIDGARHEILQERDIYRAQVLAAIDSFFPQDDADEEPLASYDQERL